MTTWHEFYQTLHAEAEKLRKMMETKTAAGNILADDPAAVEPGNHEGNRRLKSTTTTGEQQNGRGLPVPFS